MTSPLRPYQLDAIERCRAEYRASKRAICIVAPTGAGKTRVGVELVTQHLARRPGSRVLWLAHRRELVQQAVKRIQAEGAPPPRILTSGRWTDQSDSPVMVASVQSLLEQEEWPQDVTMVILDEAHHYVSREWSRVASVYGSGTVRLGLTATPERGDGTGLGEIFDSIVPCSSVAELTEQGWLVPCDIVGPRSRRKTLAGGGVVEAYHTWCATECADPFPWRQGRCWRMPRTVVYCANVAHAEEVAREFGEEGIEAAVIEGNTHDRDRDLALERFAAGDLPVLVNVYVLTEGWDCPSTECAIVARGVGHAGTWLQMIGRILRPAPGKERATVVDLCGNWTMHGHPSDVREYSLEGRPIRALKGLPPLRQCQQCGAVYRPGAARPCPRCEFELPVWIPRKSTEELQKIAQRQTVDQKAAYWAKLLAECRAAGHKIGRAYYRYKARYGQEPPR